MIKANRQFTLCSSNNRSISVSVFDEVAYQESYKAMMAFANDRNEHQPDQIWVLQHPPTYTQGTGCSLDTLLPSDIPLLKTDRGGQITYHGPGQIVVYPMLALKQYGIGVKSLVLKLEQCMIDPLNEIGINAQRRQDAPGVYVDEAKIGALGLRIRKGTSYHGLSLNVDMDLSPFNNIDPCGYQGLQVTQVVDEVPSKVNIEALSNSIVSKLVESL